MSEDEYRFEKPRHDSKKEKNKQTQPCFIHKLSVEVVTHIFARLDPVSLATVSKVCAYWRHIVNDDSCWRDAFVSYFGRMPLKRLCLESWKTEYILRTHLIRKWTKGRGTIMSFNPKIGLLESMYVDSEDTSMVVASLDHGVAAKCSPITGKIDRRLLYSTNENVRLQISCVIVDKDRILWGFGQGFITLSTRTKTIASRLKVFSDFHQGAVTVLSLPAYLQEVVLSGGEDGQVKIWDVVTNSCAWNLRPVSSFARRPTCIEATPDQYIIVGYDDGSIVIWKIDMHQITLLNRNSHQDDFLEKRSLLEESLEKNKIVITGQRNSVKFISYDTETRMLIVACEGQKDVKKYSAETGECVAVFGYGHTMGTTISCMKWDKSPIPLITSLESAMNPRPPTTRKKGGIISLSSSSKSAPISRQTTPTNAKTTRVLVTGDDMGMVCLWNGDAICEDNCEVKPIRILTGHLVGISSIFIDACKVVTGSDDGWIRVWDTLTGVNIHTLGNKIPKSANVDRQDVNVTRVTNIWCNDYRGVATIGYQIKTWDFSPAKQLLNRATLRQKGKVSSGIFRDKFKYNIGCEVKESIKKLQKEKIERQQEEKHINKLSLGGLTDQEMLDYAMMLSAQDSPEKQQQHQGYAFDDNGGNDSDEELMKAVIASLDLVEQENTDVFYDDVHINSSVSSDTSSLLSQKDAWPTVSEGIRRPQTEEEELQYILELSKTEQ
ncbi:hypothetical protein INT47_002159 [Mucor saturninus]|uniref:F-box domain-containing protein n=1 Tax=Mucor saturninus TaxID=64648 RepID=A0A8H7R1N5_9FUNG|nr:hypothetical protein INT47_002159 [Mucor saturninus]